MTAGTIRRTVAGEAATQLILATFRTSGLLLAAGDVLASDQGLTAARWQVLGALSLADRPLTVPQIARRMGLTRQSVHATVNRLAGDGLLELVPNADHLRSQLVQLTEPGRETYAAVDTRQAAWVNRLSDGIDPDHIQTAAWVLQELGRRLEAAAAGDGEPEVRSKGRDR
ncbi:MAG TPA: MarR family transcriptional regulator [Actinomycetes bacterium]|nr:MarR family transcriptional regulator [Actinomycetes bacterium]